LDVRAALIGIAALVVSAFWAVVLVVLVSGIGLIIILAAVFSVFLAMGIYLIMSALGGTSGRERGRGVAGARRGLSVLDMTVLQMTSQRKSRQEIAAATGVSQAVIMEKAEELSKNGYLTDDSLSEKGFVALRDSTGD